MDTDAMLSLLKEVSAQVITPRFGGLGDQEVMEKRPGDLVTVADHEAEELITAALHAEDGQVLVVGEEAAAADRSLLDRLADADHAYTVDPIDGTKNFVNGSPNYAVMVAEVQRGEPVRAWIWQPEYRTSYVAERGAGVYRNGRRLSGRTAPSDPADWRVLTSRPDWEGRHGRITMTPSAWCCGVDYPWLAEGDVQAAVYLKALPWDHAPGSLLVREMGGVVCDGRGTPYQAAGVGWRGLVCAVSPSVWQTVATDVQHLFR